MDYRKRLRQSLGRVKLLRAEEKAGDLQNDIAGRYLLVRRSLAWS
jgi:hypothetical protein